MKCAIILGLLVAAVGSPASFAADLARWHPRSVASTPMYILQAPPRSPQAQTVWASNACWRGCEQQCGWRFQACLRIDPQAECGAQTESCDRSCQSQCRMYGGPLLDLAN
jgi:hypothetical protein